MDELYTDYADCIFSIQLKYETCLPVGKVQSTKPACRQAGTKLEASLREVEATLSVDPHRESLRQSQNSNYQN